MKRLLFFLTCVLTLFGVARAEEYTLTLTTTTLGLQGEDFTNCNGDHTVTATSKNGGTMDVIVNSSNVCESSINDITSKPLQFKSNEGILTNVTNLGTIKGITTDKHSGTDITTSYENGIFTLQAGDGAGYYNSITIIFEPIEDNPETIIKDVINNENTYKGTGNTNYKDFENVIVNGHTYYVNCAGGSPTTGPTIQLRSNTTNDGSPHAGIVSTSSGGKVTKITFTFNSGTANSRTVGVFASNSPYTHPNDLYEEGANLVYSYTYNSADTSVTEEYEFTDSYEYVGICSTNGALYLDEVIIEWEPNNEPPTPQEPKDYTALDAYKVDGITFELGETGTLNLGESHPSITYEFDEVNAAGIKIDSEGNVTASAEGTTNVIASWEKDLIWNAGQVEFNVTVTPSIKVQEPFFNFDDGATIKVGEELIISCSTTDATLSGCIGEKHEIENEIMPYSYTFTNEDISEEFKVSVQASKDGFTTSQEVVATFKVVANPLEGYANYAKLVTSEKELEDGGYYIIVGKKANGTEPTAMTNTLSNGYFGYVYIQSNEIIGDNIFYNDNMAIVKLESEEEGKWKINVNGLEDMPNYIQYVEDKKVNLSIDSPSIFSITKNDNGSFRLAFDDDNCLQYYSGQPRFTSYKKTVQDPYLYRICLEAPVMWTHVASSEIVEDSHNGTHKVSHQCCLTSTDEEIEHSKLWINVTEANKEAEIATIDLDENSYSVESTKDGIVVSLNKAGTYTLTPTTAEGVTGYVAAEQPITVTIAPLTINVGSLAETESSTDKEWNPDGNTFEGLLEIESGELTQDILNQITVNVTPVGFEVKNPESYQEAGMTPWLWNQLTAISANNKVDGFLTKDPQAQLNTSGDLTITTTSSGVYKVTFTSTDEDIKFTTDEQEVSIYPSLTNKYTYNMTVSWVEDGVTKNEEKTFTNDGLSINDTQMTYNGGSEATMEYPTTLVEGTQDQYVIYDAENLDHSNLIVPGLYLATYYYNKSEVAGSTPQESDVENMNKRRANNSVPSGFVEATDNVLDLSALTVGNPITLKLYAVKNGAVSDQLNIRITANDSIDAPTDVDSIDAEDGEVEYFTIDGIKVQNPEKGIFIVRKGNKTFKVIK